ncbi:MAG: single stranded DNA-binding protein [Parcubacteria group bacterium Gr01-1014_18]|nr:MAG: single stranded DNA-binding protein [Parcubacteria group bacterium Greene0416_36]TSC79689.1 MAG: single stranded DNA-binding protein [Parcubacteria group bacterium Gr01-1014_18]TSC97863.1 MAG: single stranded DNA-binding protein [Parcubacteria group bacterium Greene1014_20]TSD06487.1 MAG: single stranded DNA-binding protein [Parcubacteria group bacterium Greene0714_2]
MDLNKAMIIGRLTKDPEAKSLTSGSNVSTFSVATNLRWTDAQGQKQDKVEYHNIVTWKKLADIAAQYLKKGSQVYIEGRIQTRSWQDQTGNTRYRTEIIAESMIMLGSAPGGAGGGTAGGEGTFTPKVPKASFTPSASNSTSSANPASSSGPKSSESAPSVGGAPIPTVDIKEEEIKLEDIPF